MEIGLKLLTFAVPCYNSADYMDHCIETLLECGDDIEIIIVDDGSKKDDTAHKADEWQKRHPDIIRAIHQENGGHGEAVNTGLRNAQGLYFKVVDSDDWLDREAALQVMSKLREFTGESAIDLFICNYVYEHVADNKQFVMNYKRTFPENRVFGWDDVGRFPPSTCLLMHSVFYRTQVLRDCKLELPKHTFYVDNIFVYVPLPQVKTIYYLDADLYRYFIGREDQSVNESIMISRIDQQLRITRIMIDAVKIPDDVPSKRLEKYMVSYLTIMMAICSIFTILSDRPDKLEIRKGIWDYLRACDTKLYWRIRYSIIGVNTNLSGSLGRRTSVSLYHTAQKIFKFN